MEEERSRQALNSSETSSASESSNGVDHDSSSSSSPPMDLAAISMNPTVLKCIIRLQTRFRGVRARQQVRLKRLRKAWNELDQKEESELPNIHKQYTDLTKALRITRSASRATKQSESEGEEEDDEGEQQQQQQQQEDGDDEDKEEADEFETEKNNKKSKKKEKGKSKKEKEKASKKSKRKRSRRSDDDESENEEKEEEEEEEEESTRVKQDTAEDLVLPADVTPDYCTRLMDFIRKDNLLPSSMVRSLIERIKPQLRSLPSLVRIQTKSNARCTVVGDLHGQLADLLHIFQLNGLPSSRNLYIFNGDWVDRGTKSVEIVCILCAWKLALPDYVHFNRGNHESRDLNGRDGFERECFKKYKGPTVFRAFSDLFSCVPVATVLNNEVFVVHGGLPRQSTTLKAIENIDRFHAIPPVGSLFEALLWSDPQKKDGSTSNPRGAGCLFGPNITKKFLDSNKLKLIVRSHECVDKGFQPTHGDGLMTVFSASNYCGVVDNHGAIVTFFPPTSSDDASSSASILPLPKRTHIVTYRASAVSAQPASRLATHLLESDVLSRVARRISMHRLALTDHYSKLASSSVNGVKVVTRKQWQDGLCAVLGMQLPFLTFQFELGLPRMGVDGKTKGAVDYLEWLTRFTPVNLSVLELEKTADQMNIESPSASSASSSSPSSNVPSPSLSPPPSSGDSVLCRSSSLSGIAAVQYLLDSLHSHSFELESLFRYLDLDGDGCVSIDEFEQGISALGHLLHRPLLDRETKRVIQLLDTNQDGQISYDEFFGAFQLNDPNLAQRQREADEAHHHHVTAVPTTSGLNIAPALKLEDSDGVSKGPSSSASVMPLDPKPKETAKTETSPNKRPKRKCTK